MSATIQETTSDGLTSLVVEDSSLRMVILPELGAKVISLVLKETGREYLWRHPGRHFRLATYGDPYERYDISGWDECFPTISEVAYPEGPWKGVVVPDHGELWTLPWHWDFRTGVLRMWTHSVRFAYHFERTFSFRGAGRVDISYAVGNPTSFAFKALWSMHPFLNVSPITRVLLPPGVLVRVELSKGLRMGDFLTEHPWPMTVDHNGRAIDLSLMGPHDQGYVEKLYTTRVPEGWAALYEKDERHFLAFNFDPGEVPFVGICQIRGGWPAEGVPSYSVILEPCNGWPDRLDWAILRGSCIVIPPQGERHWKVTLHLGRAWHDLEDAVGTSLSEPTEESRSRDRAI